MKGLVSTLAVVATLLAGCGGGGSASTGASGASGASGAVGDQSTTPTGAGVPSDMSANDQAAIENTVRTWLTKGDCDLMTEHFLEKQTFEKNQDVACKTFQTLFQPPSFSADQINVEDIQGSGSSASAKVSDTLGTGVVSKYKFAKVGDTWQIDKVNQ